MIKSYNTFLVNLVSAHSDYTPAVLRSLIARFPQSASESSPSQLIMSTVAGLHLPILSSRFNHLLCGNVQVSLFQIHIHYDVTEYKDTVTSGTLLGQAQQDRRKQFEDDMRHVHSTISAIFKAVPL